MALLQITPPVLLGLELDAFARPLRRGSEPTLTAPHLHGVTTTNTSTATAPTSTIVTATAATAATAVAPTAATAPATAATAHSTASAAATRNAPSVKVVLNTTTTGNATGRTHRGCHRDHRGRREAPGPLARPPTPISALTPIRHVRS